MFRLKTNKEIVHTWLLQYSTDQLFTSGTYLRCLDLKKRLNSSYLTLTIFYWATVHFRNIFKMSRFKKKRLNSSYLTLTIFYWSAVHFRNIFKMFRLKTNEEIVHTWLSQYSTDQLFTSGTYLRCLD